MAQTSSGKKKLTWLLMLQGWTMLLVVIGHSPLYDPTTGAALDNFWHALAVFLQQVAASFRMPLFFMISGYLFNMTRIEKGWQYGATLKDKWIRLGIPYFVFITLAIIMKILLPGDMNRQLDMSAYGLVANYLEPFNGALLEMWFINVIFWYFILFPLYPYLTNNRWTVLATCIIAVGMFFIPREHITQFLSLDLAVHYFVYFLLGIIINKFRLEGYISSWTSIGISMCLYVPSYMMKIVLVPAITGAFLCWGLATKIDRIFTNNLFSSFRNYTYQIFLIGIFAQIVVKILYTRFPFPGCYPIYWIICVLVGVYFPVVLSKLAYKSGNRFILTMLGLNSKRR